MAASASGHLSPTLAGCWVLDLVEKVEEEKLPSYRAGRYYPVRVGEVFKKRYQVLLKLGYDEDSTIWLCRDLEEKCYLALEVKVRKLRPERLVPHENWDASVSRYLRRRAEQRANEKRCQQEQDEEREAQEEAQRGLRLVVESFEVAGPSGSHRCLVYRPLWLTLAQHIDNPSTRQFPHPLVESGAQVIAKSLAHLHENEVIYTNLSPDNVVFGLDYEPWLAELVKAELSDPLPRHVRSDRTIYTTLEIAADMSLPVLCDFGEARVGERKFEDKVMPRTMRAPEVILDMPWDDKIDIWAFAMLMWYLVDEEPLFFSKKTKYPSDEELLAGMVGLLGPPPLSFLQRSEESKKYWDAEGNWKGSLPIVEQTFECREQTLSGRRKEQFCQFLRRTLRWLPEERPTAADLVYDPFIIGEDAVRLPRIRLDGTIDEPSPKARGKRKAEDASNTNPAFPHIKRRKIRLDSSILLVP